VSGISNYLANIILDVSLRGVGIFPSNSGLYIALNVSDPTNNGDLTSEVIGGSYGRQLVTAWNPASAGAITNSAQIQWTGMPATSILYVSAWDALNGGNMYYSGLIEDGLQVVNAGNTVTMLAGELVIKANPS
jgi:hypothetical protein